MILDLLACITHKTNIQEMPEAQAFLTYPLFSEGFANSQSNLMVGLTLLAE